MDTAAEHVVFDPSVLGAMFGDETALIASVLQTFKAGTRANLADLALAIDAQDFDAVAALAHKMAGASRMSGALALGDSARKLELATKRGEVATLAQDFAALEAQWALAQDAIAKLPGHS
ncbi:Hpt domain-containing protein [Rhodoferax sp. AJA081-3]|uniref:Hpt domain-containing protein n=1 Tax=Rhodoferax sp. AJA081-3 TaxID=2752316 RepID=UPI001ADEDDA7|nr:Hpt domain-containing protein [Rhodoferax sp. AJA081-3]QTN27896.1 Hpt domain-containing protein [Rhodoferax sp. AJA081-3]